MLNSRLFGFYLLVTLMCLIHSGVAVAHELNQDSVQSTKKQRMRIAILMPRENPHWKFNQRYAQAAADQLDVELIVHVFHDDQNQLIETARKACHDDIDGIVFEPYGEVTEQVIALANQHQIPVFTVKSPLKNQRLKPREQYPYWIGQCYHDYQFAGQDLMRQLATQAQRNGINELHILAVRGLPNQNSENLRVQGMQEAVKELENVGSFHMVQANFSGQQAVELFKKHIAAHPETNVIWSASSNMALAVSEEIKRMGIKRPMMVGGIGITLPSMHSVNKGEIKLLMGPTTLNCALAITLLHGYHHGNDFADENTVFTEQLYVVDRMNIDRIYYFISLPPESIDFATMSKTLHPDRAIHAYTFAELVENTLADARLNVSRNINLSHDELLFLKSNPVIRVGYLNKKAPFSFNPRGRPEGIAIDYLEQLEKRLGIKFKYVAYESKSDLINAVASREVDLMANGSSSTGLSSGVITTEPYAFCKPVIIGLKGQAYESLESLKGKRVAIAYNSEVKRYLRDKYGEDYFEIVDEDRDFFDHAKALSEGKLDAVIGADMIFRYVIKQYEYENLVISDRIGPSDIQIIGHHIALRSDWTTFEQILQKVMEDVSEQAITEIKSKWLIDVNQKSTKSENIAYPQTKDDLYKLLIMCACIVVLFVLGNWLLLKLLAKRLPVGIHSGTAKMMALVLVAFFIGIGILSTGFGLTQVRQNVIHGTGEELSMVRGSSLHAFKTMLDSDMEQLKQVAHQPDTVYLTQNLVVADEINSVIQKEDTRQSLHEMLGRRELNHRIQNYAIISNDYITLASSKSSLHDHTHPVTWQYPEHLKRAFDGETLFVPPVFDVPEKTDDPGRLNHASTYILSPIRGPNGQIIAVLGFAYNAHTSLSELVHLNRFGQSGDSYLIDGHGRLASQLRYQQDLYHEGLLVAGQSEVLHLKMLDQANQGAGQSESAAYIYPVNQALQKQEAISTEATLDHRGVSVISAWTWDEDLGIGVISQIDESEALASYYDLRAIIIVVLLMTIALAFTLTGFFIWNGDRVNHQLKRARDEWEKVAQSRMNELKLREEKFHTVFDQTVQRMAILDLDGRMLEVNQQGKHEIEEDDASFLGNYFWEAPWFQFSEELQHKMRSLVYGAREGRCPRFEYTDILSDGSIRYIDHTITTINNRNGEPEFIIPMGHDITERKLSEMKLEEARNLAIKQSEELSQALQTSEELRGQALDATLKAEEAARGKAQFLSTMSHEIRTPLNGVLGMVQLLQESPLNSKQEKQINTIHESGIALITIINDILDLSKLDAGGIELETVSFNPQRLISGVINLMENRALEKDLVIRSEVEQSIPDKIMGDPDRIRQVLLNLVTNAIKFTKVGGVTIKLCLDGQPEKPMLKFQVIDTGIGIDDAGRKKLFKEFSQVDANISRNYGGTGLGLAISQKIIGLLGGQIDVHSEPGKGSTFWFTIPMLIDESSDTDAKAITSTLPSIKLPELHVLVADDNLINREVIQAFLVSENHNVTLVCNGEQAVSAYKSAHHDLILMDIHMPVMDGIQATAAIRELETNGKRTPIIGITASAEYRDAQACIAVNMDDYIPKPVQFDQLRQIIAKFVLPTMDAPAATVTGSSDKCDALLDLPHLEQLVNIISRDKLIDIIQTYQKEILPEIQSLDQCCKAGEYERLFETAHRIKGASSQIGLKAIVPVLALIEDFASGNEVNDIKETLSELRKLTQESLQSLKVVFPEAFNDTKVDAYPSKLKIASQSKTQELIIALSNALASCQPHRVEPFLEQLKEAQKSGLLDDELNETIKLAEKYQFKAAMTKLNATIKNNEEILLQ